MHNSYYFLRRVASELNERLRDYRLVSCFSQNRDELFVEFYKEPRHFFIRANLLPELSSVSFPSSVRRARKNSIDLFPDLIMQKAEGARSFENDRSFQINLNDGLALLFKMHGNRSNVLLTKENRVTDAFKKSIAADLNLNVAALEKKIDWSMPVDPRKEIFTFSKEVWRYLNSLGFADRSAKEQWKMILNTQQRLCEPTEYFHIEEPDGLSFSLLPYNSIVATYTDALEAVTTFVARHSSTEAFRREKTTLIRHLRENALKAESYLKKTRDHLNQISTDQHFQVWGDLLMANLDKIGPGEESTTLPNFYDGDNPVSIRLNPQLSPQKNAEVYYRKAKNRAIEISRTRETLIAKEMELLRLMQQVTKADASETLDQVRALATDPIAKKSGDQPRVPYREIVFAGYRIWIGKDAEANDELTSRYGYKEDLWLHAKDSAGSHVLIKHQAGKVFPKPVIERAAQLAAFHSKRKTDSLCPVAYTPKKYVRKRKGDPAGTVVVEREKVILVEPKGI